MSTTYSAVGWSPQKKLYDLLFLLLAGICIVLFSLTTLFFHPEVTAETLMIRGSAFTAILLFHVLLSIGPLTRIDSRCLPLLYNRRHLGVFIFCLGLFHAALSTFQFHALGNIPAPQSLLGSYSYEFLFWKPGGALSQVPFEPFGLLTLWIFLVMAATSHDFWLKSLGALNWKKIHLFVYLAYFSLILHISWGVLQSERHPILPLLLWAGVLWLATLHTLAYRKDRKRRNSGLTLNPSKVDPQGFRIACNRSRLQEGKAQTLSIDGHRIAIFLHQGQVRAVSNVCRHQGGPLGEGRIIDGCITCPWHGWQYRPEDGCSPPPFKEVIATYPTRVENDQVWVKIQLGVTP